MQTLLALPFPAIDPVAIAIGPLKVRWYGLAYMAGLLLGWLYIRRLLHQTRLWPAHKAPFSHAATDDLLLWMTLGIVAGGRLGQVLFYDLGYYARHPLEILAIWNGGMSFHGGLLGAGLVAWAFARRHGTSVWSVMDACSAAVPIGIFFGRIANFINSEHWGRPSGVAWAVVFPNGGPVPRHPSQLYEALLEGLVLFLLLRYATHVRLDLKRPGAVTGLFLAGYALARIFCELYRAPEIGAPLNIGPITTGMMYSLPMLVLGVYFVWRARAAATSEAA
jgi:phosphatidylglycerol:prolipoprotein diacylglycerol transferase